VTRGAHYFSDVLIGSWLGILVSILLYHYMFGGKNARG
jgi:membrane-associated phospholipid phosphatase